MKKLITIILFTTLLSSCSDEDSTTSRAVLSNKIKNNQIYTIDPFNHIVFEDTSIYHYRTDRFSSEIRYIYKIK